MITSNRQDYLKDLYEVLFEFTTGEGLDITHFQSQEGSEFFDDVTINGREYKYKNSYNYNGILELKRYEKRFSKLSLYLSLEDYLGVSLTWGALTGIRPVKMARDLGDNFHRDFTEIFKVTPKKIALVQEILEVQKTFYDKNGEYSGLFIGIPFCPSRCLYCSFVSEIVSKSKFVNEYVTALIKEIDALNVDASLRSVYVGGGTPVCLTNEQFESVLKAIKSKIKWEVEFTVEAGRPDVITPEKLKIMKDYGVTRICVNPQTFNDKTLEIIGRKHTAEDIKSRFFLAKSYGFKINCDLIAGLNGETLSDFKYSLLEAIKLNPENVTVHTLCLKKGSVLKTETVRLEENDIDKIIDYSYQELKRNGYRPYYLYRQKYAKGNLENVGYAKPNEECIYNVDVMEETSNNFACGANAVSKRVFPSENRIERYGSPKDIKTYIDKVDQIIQDKNKLFN